SNKIEGRVIEGEMDPAVVGSFKMTPRMSSMAASLRIAAKVNNQDTYVAPKYAKSAIAGNWVLMWEDKAAVFRVRLEKDGIFRSKDGLGSGQLGGRWNTWDADKMFITVVRTKSSGVEMTGDHMFWGTKITGPEDSKV
ncbi:unnamed protein product, partial [Choristocarpus tenellus]